MRDFRKEYMEKLRTPEEAVQVIKSGDWVDYTSSLGKPVLLDRALAKRRDELYDVKIRGNLISGPIEVAECDESQEHFIYHTWHCSAYERKLCDRGLCYLSPWCFIIMRLIINIFSMSMWSWSVWRPWTVTGISIIQ